MAKQVGSPSYMQNQYAEYQAQYRSRLKESDAVLLELIDGLVAHDDRSYTIVDVGCHTGNLLYHLRQRHPRAKFVGWDIFPAVIDACRKDPALAGVSFEVMNLLDVKAEALADIVILSAVLFRFGDEQHETAWRQLWKALKPGGHAIVFDWYHEFRQTVRMVDETDLHPDGLVLNMRSQRAVEDQLHQIGFDSVRFFPFNIPIDLERKDPGDAVSTHTRMTGDGRRLQFRGVIYQPWCHMTARKA